MTTYSKSGSFGWAGGGKSGAIVDLWLASRFSGPPAENQAPPSGSPDAGPVTTGATFGNPGAYIITGIATLADYYVRIQYGGQTFWGAAPASSLGGGTGGVQSVVAGTNVMVDDTDPANPVVSAAATDVPIANPTGITYGAETPDTISGADSATWIEFPTSAPNGDATAVAWGLQGDDFPRVVFGADPTDIGAVAMGDGTFDPALSGAFLGVQVGGNRAHLPILGTYSSGSPLAATLGAVAIGGWESLTTTPSGAADFNDVVFSRWTTGASVPVVMLWRCTVGSPSAATFVAVSAAAAVDPITASYTPTNAGILWQDTSGSGSVWMSTGTSLGDWAQVSQPLGVADYLDLVQSAGASLSASSLYTITGMTVNASAGSDISLNADTKTIDIASGGVYAVSGYGNLSGPAPSSTAFVQALIGFASGTGLPNNGGFIPAAYGLGAAWSFSGSVVFVVTSAPASFTVQIATGAGSGYALDADSHLTMTRLA